MQALQQVQIANTYYSKYCYEYSSGSQRKVVEPTRVTVCRLCLLLIFISYRQYSHARHLVTLISSNLFFTRVRSKNWIGYCSILKKHYSVFVDEQKRHFF